MAIDNLKAADITISKITEDNIPQQTAVQGERSGRSLLLQITNGGTIENQTGVSVNLGWSHDTAKNSDGEKLQGLDSFQVVDRAKGIFRLDYPSNMMVPGRITAVIQIIGTNSDTRSKPFKIKVEGSPFDDEAAETDNSFTALQEALIKAENFSGGPLDTLNSIEEANAKYPNGANGPIIILEADGETGYSYTWTGTEWKKGVLYQEKGIADDSIDTKKYKDDSVTAEKTSFTNSGKNLLNKNRIIDGQYMNTTGQTIAHASYCVFPEVSLSLGQSIILNDSNGNIIPFRFVTAFNSAGSVLPSEGNQNINGPYVAQSQTKKVVISISNTYLSRDLMLSYGTTIQEYEDYLIVLADNVAASEKMLDEFSELPVEGSKVNSLPYTSTDFYIPTENLLDPNMTGEGYVDKDGRLLTSLPGYWHTSKIQVESGDQIQAINRLNAAVAWRKLCAYDSSGNVMVDAGIDNPNMTTDPYIVPDGIGSIIVSFREAASGSANNTMIYVGTDTKAFSEFAVVTVDGFGLSEQQKGITRNIVREEINAAGGESMGKVKIEKSDSLIGITSFNSDGDEITINVSLDGSQNKTFNFSNTILNNSVIHTTPDDITPIRTFTTVGANHGYPSCYEVTGSHDKNESDLGSVWSDGNNNYTLLRLASNSLIFAKEYKLNSDETITVESGSIGNSLTHISGATNTSTINNIAVKSIQLYPSVKNSKTEIVEIPEDGVFYVEQATINDSYEIIDYKSLLDWSTSHVGKKYEENLSSIESVAKINQIYQFSNFGRCLVSYSVQFLKKSLVNNCGFLQSVVLPGNTMRYMPDVSVSGYDFENGVEMSNYSQNLIITNDQLIDSEFPPVRYFDISDNCGFAMGYIFDKGNGMPDKRKITTTKYWDLRSTKKSYPVGIDSKISVFNVGDYFTFQGYRNYFLMDDHLTHFSTVEDGEAYYVFIDAHKKIDFLSKEIPGKIGQSIEVLRSKNIELFNDSVSAEGITFKTAGVGYMVLKIRK